MHIAGIYSFNCGKEVIAQQHRPRLDEILQIIQAVDVRYCRAVFCSARKASNRRLYNTSALNNAFREQLLAQGWQNYRVAVEYSQDYYVPGYHPRTSHDEECLPYKEMDFVRDRLGIEMQFDKGSFQDMIYDICEKMTIFARMDVIDCGIEIVPTQSFVEQMSTEISCFEELVWNLEQRGVADIDIPLLILGIDAVGIKSENLATF